MSAIDAESSNRRRKRHASPKTQIDEYDSRFRFFSSSLLVSIPIFCGLRDRDLFIFDRTQIPRLDFF
ncbi:hypothetical protein Csa_006827 [Cucumis sativus]|uniref:Uncharacterized protein n=1 Tax=Cucumis sativus TaxID=3659 RepID=A0A0A0LMC5_CUCSA|nr:hypothetical protein Csa_006827 [Cucumis sativus]